MAYSISKLEFVNIIIERKIRERKKHQVVISECWESKFNYKPNWDDCSSECMLEKNRLKQNFNRYATTTFTLAKVIDKSLPPECSCGLPCQDSWRLFPTGEPQRYAPV